MIPTQAVAPSQEEILKQIPTRAHITNRMVAAFKVSIINHDEAPFIRISSIFIRISSIFIISNIFTFYKESERPTAAIAHVLPQ